MCFEVVSGLGLNLRKSVLIVVGDVSNLDQLAADLNCGQGKLSSIYLGLPLGATYKQKEVWAPLVERMRKHLNGWKAQYLSKGGRLTLIKASLASFPFHYLSVLVMPKSIGASLEKFQRDFLWRKEDEGRSIIWYIGKGCALQKRAEEQD